MRALLWLLWLAFAVECVALTMLASFVMMSLDSQHRAPPGFTGMFFAFPKVWLLLPIPWLVAAAFLSRRSFITTGIWVRLRRHACGRSCFCVGSHGHWGYSSDTYFQMNATPPDHALHPACAGRPSRSGCHPRVPRAGSPAAAGLGR